MRRAVVAPAFPATLLILRVGRLVLPIPWMLVWVLVLAVTPLCWLAGLKARRANRADKAWFLRHWHQLAILLVIMRGTTICARSKDHCVCLRWL